MRYDCSVAALPEKQEADIVINEIKIENFRGFSSLELKDLKRVNLIVGHNNSGKTSLLEGILLLSEPNRSADLPEMFRAKQGDADTRFYRWLFHDGMAGQFTELSCTAGNVKHRVYLSSSSHRLLLSNPEARQKWSLHRDEQRFQVFEEGKWAPLTCRAIPVQHRDASTLVSLVGNANRKREGEETLQAIAAYIDPRIRKVRVDPGKDGNQVIVDIGLSELVPISQAGQGVYRLVSILAEIIGEQPKVVLIDEVENGLHHSVHEQVWAGLAETAEKLDVQIFATTHSHECLLAAHKAFAKRKHYDFGVIQLFRVESGIQGRVLDKEHIEAAIAGDIELR